MAKRDYKEAKMDGVATRIEAREEKRQKETLSLIPSENYASCAVRSAMASSLANKYSEGYPGKRYYPGNKYADEMECLAQKRALELFDLNETKWDVNVQVHSGSPANFAVYSALVPKHYIILGMQLASGGHLTHGHSASFTSKFFNFKQYGVNDEGLLNYEDIEKLTEKYKPALIVVGATAYSRIIDFKKFSQIARKHNALLMADVAHIAGLIAGGVHPSPFPYCDVVTTTTHKTLRGPRGAIIFSKKELTPAINKAVFPGLQGGPHNHQTTAIAVALKEAKTAKFKTYAKQIVKNAQVLASELTALGFKIVSGGTDNHLMLADLRNKNISGGEAEKLLERNGITANRNTIPNDPRSPFDPSGLRIGTPAVTTRGMKEKEMKQIAKFIAKTLRGENVKTEVKKLAIKFPPPKCS